MTKKYSDITLERYILEELSASEYQTIKMEEQSDSNLRERITLLRTSDEQILKEYTPEFIASRIRGSLRPSAEAKNVRRHLALKILIPSGAALAALTGLLFLFPAAVHQVEPIPAVISPQTETIRFKGDDAKLYLYKKTAEGSEQIQSGSAAHDGEILQIAYASSKKYGIIFSIDGRGTVTKHFPSEGSAAAELQPGGTHYLKASYQLDDAPSFERFVIVASDKQFNTDSILSKAGEAAKDMNKAQSCSFAADGFSEQSFLIIKKAEQ